MLMGWVWRGGERLQRVVVAVVVVVVVACKSSKAARRTSPAVQDISGHERCSRIAIITEGHQQQLNAPTPTSPHSPLYTPQPREATTTPSQRTHHPGSLFLSLPVCTNSARETSYSGLVFQE